MDYLKRNHLSLLIIVGLVVVFMFSGERSLFGANARMTNILNPHTFQDDVTFNDPVTLTDTASLATTTTNGPVLSSPGYLSTTTMGTATTLSEADLLYNEYWNVVPNVAADHTFTMPATSSLTTFIPNAGDRRTIYVKLASTTAASSTESIFATNTGFDLEGSSTLRVAPRNTLKLEFIRDVSTDITLIVTPYTDAD